MTGLRAISALLLVAAACSRAPAHAPPVPVAIIPAAGDGTVAQPIEIAGFGFDAQVETDLSGSGGTVNGGFTARLEPAGSGPAVPLSGVAQRDRQRIAAVVPAGLAMGVYRLVLTDPRGRTGILDGAYHVVGSNGSVTALRVSVPAAVQAGVPFTATVEAVAADGLVVEGADAAVTLSDATGALSPSAPGRLAAGRLLARVTIGVLAAGDRIEATDGAGHSGTSAAFDVVAGGAQALAFPDAAVTAAAGACSPPVRLELRDGLGHAGANAVDRSVSLQSAPPGAVFFADAGCGTPTPAVVIPAGSSSVAFRFRSAAAGVVRVRARTAALPSATQDEQVSP